MTSFNSEYFFEIAELLNAILAFLRKNLHDLLRNPWN
jgi:hypothetical protein